MLLASSADAGGPTSADSAQPAPLFNDLGGHQHSITTASMDAQRYFNQGLTLGFSFNHAEAQRSFRYAAMLDPQCAMCWWGVAFVLGPNVNAPMGPSAAAAAWEAVQKAQALATKVTPREQAYIAAVAQRYAAEPPADRAPLDTAFANAMRDVARQYPDDLDASALFAEALMDLTPWNYYDKSGKPLRPEATEIVTTLESVLARNPEHPWAIHQRAGKWQEILDTKAPHEGLDYHAGIWHYARGRAFVGTGDLDSAGADLAALRKIAGKDDFKKGVSAADVLNVAVEVLAGEVAAGRGHAAEAVAHLEKGVELEDALPYREPADWLYPPRRSRSASTRPGRTRTSP